MTDTATDTNTNTNPDPIAFAVEAINESIANLHSVAAAADAAGAVTGGGIHSAARAVCAQVAFARACAVNADATSDAVAAACWRASVAVARNGYSFQRMLQGAADELGLGDYAI